MFEALNGLAAAIDRTNVLVAADEEIDSWWRDRPFGQDGSARATEDDADDLPPLQSRNLTPTPQQIGIGQAEIYGRWLLPLAAAIFVVVVILIAIVENRVG